MQSFAAMQHSCTHGLRGLCLTNFLVNKLEEEEEEEEIEEEIAVACFSRM